jgi:ubiquinone biosynthesis protein COQ4
MLVLDRLRLRAKFLAFVRRPTRTNLIFEMVDISSRLPENQPAVALVENRALAHGSFRQLWEERWHPPFTPLTELSLFPQGSFGCAFLGHLMEHNIRQEFYRAPSIKRPIDYVSLRLYHTHDLWHVLLGYDVSPAGELGVQAFALAQIGTPVSSLLIVGGILSVLMDRPQESGPLFDTVVRAYERGQQSRFLLGFRLERMFNEPLESVRRHVGIVG